MFFGESFGIWDLGLGIWDWGFGICDWDLGIGIGEAVETH